mgnify:CR=1 FL=1
MIQPKNKREPGNPNWGGAREESKLIQKYADQWCRDHGYPLQRRKWVYRGKWIKAEIRQRCLKYGRNMSEKRQVTDSVYAAEKK